MKLAVKILSFLVSLACIFLIYFFRIVPSGKLWDEYSILYVPVSLEDDVLMSVLEENGIEKKDVVSLSSQFLPLTLIENTPEYTMFRLTYVSDENTYDNRRNAYFYDSTNNYRLYYIPSSYKKNIDKVVAVLGKMKIQTGTDSSFAYPWIVPAIALLFTILLFIFAKNKICFLCGSVAPFYFVYCNPFFPACFAALLFQFTVLFLSNIWNRKGALKYLLTRPYVILILILSFVCAFGATNKSGYIYIAAVAVSLIFIYLYHSIQSYFLNKNHFKPIMIKPAKKKSLFNGKNKVVCISITAVALLALGCFQFTNSETYTYRPSIVQLPADTQDESVPVDSNLPQLNEYARWLWNIQVAPYKSLNKNQEDLNEVFYPEFIKNEDGVLIQQNKKLSYNQNYIDMVIDNIDNLNFNAIEKVIKSQNPDFKGTYQVVSTISINNFGIITMLIAVFMLLFLLISTMIGKGIVK